MFVKFTLWKLGQKPVHRLVVSFWIMHWWYYICLFLLMSFHVANTQIYPNTQIDWLYIFGKCSDDTRMIQRPFPLSSSPPRLNLTFLPGLEKFSSEELANWLRSCTSLQCTLYTIHCNILQIHAANMLHLHCKYGLNTLQIHCTLQTANTLK